MATKKRNYHHTAQAQAHSHLGMNIFATILAIIVLLGCVLGGLQLWGTGKQKPSNWGKSEVVVAETDPKVDPTPLPKNGGMEMPETVEEGTDDERTGVKSSGIALMSATIPVAKYAAYGVSPASETAKTVTATVLPDNDAPNTAVTWKVEWKSSDSAWAQGKTVTDYVTISFDDSDFQKSKTCTVSCSQAFGEQIILKVAAKEDESKFATCNINYVQQVKSVSAKIGDISVVLGGNTDVTIKVRTDQGGAGGKVTVTPTLSDVYTLENSFTPSAQLTHEGSLDRNAGSKNWLAYRHEYGGASGTTILSYDDDDSIVGDSIYFDRTLFTKFNFYAGGTNMQGSQIKPSEDRLFTSLNYVKDLVDNFNNTASYGPFKNTVIWTMKVTLSSEKYTFTYESDIVWAEIDERVPIVDVQINDGQDIVFP